MKIEKINDNQIKCTLTRSDLASRQIRLSELTYGTEKAKGLFQDMMEQANLELGFDISDFPLMIEAIPVSMDCIILMITKVDDPEDVDPEVSELTNYDDIFSGDPQDEFDFSSFFSSLASAGLGQSPVPSLPHVPAVSTSADPYAIFSFDSLEAVIDLARSVSGLSIGENSLYKSREDGKFYLLTISSDKNNDMKAVYTSAQEFGTREPSGYSRAAFINEHFEKMITGDALQSLAYV